MDVSCVPVLLSDKGLQAAQQVYARRNIHSDRPAHEDYERARTIIFEGNWGDYDEVYVALYTLRLTGGKWLPRRDFRRGNRMRQPGEIQIDCVLDISLNPDYANQCLLSEWAVADIIDFRLTLGRLLPAPSDLIYVGFGCFMMSLVVPFGAERQGIPHQPDDALATLRDYLAASSLEDVKTRFAVSKFEMSASE
jgi:hypothetical protein